MNTLMWWLIPLVAVLLGVGITALATYLRRPPEDQDRGQFALMQEAMKKLHGQVDRRP